MGNPRFRTARAHKHLTRSAGDITATTTWTDVTGMEIVLAAQVGDTIEVGCNGIWASDGAGQGRLDVVSIVSSAPVGYWNGSGAAAGVQAWLATTASVIFPFGGSIMKDIVSGDLSAGLVTLRLRSSVSSSTRSLFASGSNVLHFYAKNLGPADPN